MKTLWFGPGPAQPGVKKFALDGETLLTKLLSHTVFFEKKKSSPLVCLRGRCPITIPEFPVSASLVANIAARNKRRRSFHQRAKAVKRPKL